MARTGKASTRERERAGSEEATRGERDAAERGGSRDAAVEPGRANDRGGDAAVVSANGERAGVGQPMIDLEFLRGLIATVDKSTIDSLEITRAGTRIRIAKTPPPGRATAPAPAPEVPAAPEAPPVAVAPAPPSGPAAEGAGAPVAAPTAEEAPAAEPELVEVKSPMVGTFYRAPAPEAPPYVEVGGEVNVGQTLCILEAMKLMNELESEVSGTVREILIENTEPVEYGQVLFRIEPR